MLAPEDESRAMAALRFSLASEIVELVVLTNDDVFLQTLREAVGPARRLWHVPTSDKVSDLLIAGGVGILVLDVQTVQAASRFVTEIKRQFPDLVVVAAGNRDAENSLARLISDGTIYRFIHKPMSPARARLFADVAVKRYDQQRSRTGGASPAFGAPRSRLVLFGAAGLGVLFAGIWLLQRNTAHVAPSAEAPGPPASGAPTPRTPAPGAPAAGSETGSDLLARAAQALAANRLTAPSGDNALELYLEVLAQNPADKDARAGIADVRERLLAHAENALLEERLDEAAAEIESARKAGVDSGRVALLSAQLAKVREQIKAAAELARIRADAAAPTRGAPVESAAPRNLSRAPPDTSAAPLDPAPAPPNTSPAPTDASPAPTDTTPAPTNTSPATPELAPASS